MNARVAAAGGWAALSFALAACGGYTVPAAHVRSARNALEAAQGAGAAESGEGRPYLTMAQTEFRDAMGSTGEDADLLLLRCQVDAELALAATRKDVLKSQAAEARSRAQALSASSAWP